MSTFSVHAQARRANGSRVCFRARITAANIYAASDKARERLAARGAEYFPVIRFGRAPSRLLSPELALTLSTNHAEES